uniref:J domain-containing protein n=1 Tax=Skeletonema marinoi TaxID=267567 RepID=A0A7S2M6Z8_9STRA|mmetsp:Transcript_5923/g.9890  ORF Transcript_5923/g.9890 Transcript_5923/m.9890 type:complete len:613 (+) Transcript_5923:95-1933(+)
MRFDIAFFLCCCRSFLSSRQSEEESFYDLLSVDKHATQDELKRAYKRQSLQMHPDKLAQKGKSVTAEDRDRFTRMRHAYEVLSDPRRRETYDAIGERGMKWMEDPLSIDPQELAHNFATSSILDRSKIFAIFLAIYVAVFLLPILICLMADGTFGGAKWVAVLTPLWIWDVFILFYHTRVIMMGPIKRPEHIPEEEWVDPLPMKKRVSALVRFVFLVLFQVLLALKMDAIIAFPWWAVFIPLYFWEVMALKKKISLATINIVSHAELELAIGKNFAACNTFEREDIHRRFILVPAKSGPVYDAACRIKAEAKMDVVRILARVVFTVLMVLNLDLGKEWSWWIVFIPIFVMVVCIVGSSFQNWVEVQAEAAKRDPSLFDQTADVEQGYAQMDDDAKNDDDQPLTDEEKEELKAKVAQAAYRVLGTCCTQCFFLVLLCVFVGKMQGAGYSWLVIISPFLAAGGLVLCCLACTIFCVSEVDENAGLADFDTRVNEATAAAGYGATYDGGEYTPPTTEQAGKQQQEEQQSVPSSSTDTRAAETKPISKPPPTATWDPEKGEIWQNTTQDEENEETTNEVISAPKQEKSDLLDNIEDAQPAVVEPQLSEASEDFDLD